MQTRAQKMQHVVRAVVFVGTLVSAETYEDQVTISAPLFIICRSWMDPGQARSDLDMTFSSTAAVLTTRRVCRWLKTYGAASAHAVSRH